MLVGGDQTCPLLLVTPELETKEWDSDEAPYPYLPSPYPWLLDSHRPRGPNQRETCSKAYSMEGFLQVVGSEERGTGLKPKVTEWGMERPEVLHKLKNWFGPGPQAPRPSGPQAPRLQATTPHPSVDRLRSG